MSFGTKYKTKWASKKGVTGEILFQKEGYSGSIVEFPLLKDGLEINQKCDNWFSPITKQNVSISFLNDSSLFWEYDDLFGANEYEWKVIIDASDADGTSVNLFDGWLNSERTQIRYLHNSSVKLTASNNFTKLDNDYPEILDNTNNLPIINILNDALNKTGKDASLWVNMTLEPSAGLSGSVLPGYGAFQVTAVSPELFWENIEDKDDPISVITKILKPFNSYLYWWDNAWRVERYNDFNNTNKYYRKYNNSTDYLYRSYPADYNLTNDPSYLISDFDQINYSQQISIDPGLKKLTINKHTKDLTNLVINKFDYDNGDGGTYICSSTNEIYNAVDPPLRKWDTYVGYGFYEPELILGWPTSSGFITTSRGNPRRGMSNAIKRHKYPTQSLPSSYASLLSTKFQCTIFEKETTVDGSTSANGTNLTLSWKWSPYWNDTMAYALKDDDVVYKLKWFIRDVSGTSNNYYIVRGEDGSGNETWSYDVDTPSLVSNNHLNFEYVYGDGLNGRNSTQIDVTIPLSDIEGIGFDSEGEADKTFIFGVLLESYSKTGYGDGETEYYYHPYEAVYGDFVVNVDGKLNDDTLIGEINNGAIQEQSIDLDIFDLQTLQSRSGILGSNAYNKRTSEWSEENDGGTSKSLANWLLDDRFKLYKENRRFLDTEIKYGSFLKPFSIVYDDQDPSLTKYVISGYSYKPTKDTYKLNLWEYDNDEPGTITSRRGRLHDGRPPRTRVFTGPRPIKIPDKLTRGTEVDGVFYSKPLGNDLTEGTFNSNPVSPEGEPVSAQRDQTIRGLKTFKSALRTETELLIGASTASLSLADDGSTFFIQNRTPGEWTYMSNYTAGDVSVNLIGLNATKGVEMYEDVSMAGNLWVSGDINGGLFGDSVVITNNLTVGNDVSISGNLYVDGSTFQQDVTVIDSSVYNWHVLNDASIDNDLKVGGDAEIDGTLTATTLSVNAYTNLYTTTVSDDFDVLGDSTFNGDVSITGNLYVDGNAFSGTYATLTYVDGSLATLDTYIDDVSTRIPTDFYSQAYVDGSLNNKADNSDIPTDFYSQAYVDGSLNNKADNSDIPTDFYSQAYVDGSLATLDNYIDDVSLRLSNVDVDVSLGGLSDVSILDVSLNDVIKYNGSDWINQETTDITDIVQYKAEFKSPDSSGDGEQGDLAYDASYFYICTSTNVWIRILGEGGY